MIRITSDASYAGRKDIGNMNVLRRRRIEPLI